MKVDTAVALSTCAHHVKLADVKSFGWNKVMIELTFAALQRNYPK